MIQAGDSIGMMVNITGINGETIMQFVKLPNDRFFGGTTCDDYRTLASAVPGPHVLMMLGRMLDLISQVANAYSDTVCWRISSDRHPPIVIAREMRADDLAEVLQCDVQSIIDHFSVLVKIA